jgi:hypothetical protein
MNAKMRKAITLIRKEIEFATSPDNATKEEAVEILREVITDAEAMIDALKDEIKSEQG